jgi:hypothetical protein
MTDLIHADSTRLKMQSMIVPIILESNPKIVPPSWEISTIRRVVGTNDALRRRSFLCVLGQWTEWTEWTEWTTFADPAVPVVPADQMVAIVTNGRFSGKTKESAISRVTFWERNGITMVRTDETKA